MPVERHKLKRMNDIGRQDLILDAIAEIDPSSEIMASAYESLSSLSTNTVIDEIDASGESVFEQSDDSAKFEAIATIYVSLNYGDNRDRVSMTDSYPALIKGSIINGKVEFADVSVDVSSFMD